MKLRNLPLLVVLFFVSLSACNRANEGNPMISAAPTEQSFSENEEVFFVFKTASMTPAALSTPSGFYVRGRIRNGQFAPEGGVVGDGVLSQSGQNGWMELATGKFYPMHTARTPSSPYVDGHLTDSGFVPSSREIK